MKGEIPGIFYLYLHSKLWDMIKGEEISKKDLKKILFQWKIPTNIRPLILKEMELMGLIEKGKRHYVKLNRPSFNDEKINRYYKKLKIF